MAAWFTACIFTSVLAKESAFNASAAGIVCAMAALLLSLVDIQPDITLFLFLPLAFALPIQEKWDWEERLLALLPALGVYALFSLLCRQTHALLPSVLAVILNCVIIAVSIAGVYILRRRFPPKNWQEYFETGSQDHIFPLRWRVYIPLALMTGILC